MKRTLMLAALLLTSALSLSACSGVSSYDPEGCGGFGGGGSCAPKPMSHGGTGKRVAPEVQALREDRNFIVHDIANSLLDAKASIADYSLGGSTADLFASLPDGYTGSYSQKYLDGPEGVYVGEMYIKRQVQRPAYVKQQLAAWGEEELPEAVESRLKELRDDHGANESGRILAYDKYCVDEHCTFSFTSASSYQRQESQRIEQRGWIVIDGLAPVEEGGPKVFSRFLIHLAPSEQGKLFELDQLPLTTQNVVDNWWNDSGRKPSRAIRTD